MRLARSRSASSATPQPWSRSTPRSALSTNLESFSAMRLTPECLLDTIRLLEGRRRP